MNVFKMKRTYTFLFIGLLVFSTLAFAASAVKLFDTSGVPQGLNIDEEGHLAVHVEFEHSLPADYYLYQTIATPVISSTASVGDIVIDVVSSTGVVAGHVITFYEGISMFQSIVVSTTATTITFASTIDFEYTADSLVEAGLWSMNVNGSVTTQVFSIKAPPLAAIDVHTINLSMLDSSPMDDGLFGGITALAPEDGLLFRFVNNITKNLALIINNLGIWEIGFTLDYSEKAPAGQYGLRARRDVPNINGVTVFINSGGESEFQIHIRSNLTDLDLVACTINGHLIVD